jgi:hypothetical protein
MTIHGVTKEMIFDATAKLDGTTLTGTARSSFFWKDFDLDPPNTAVISVKDVVNLTLTITAQAS